MNQMNVLPRRGKDYELRYLGPQAGPCVTLQTVKPRITARLYNWCYNVYSSAVPNSTSIRIIANVANIQNVP